MPDTITVADRVHWLRSLIARRWGHSIDLAARLQDLNLADMEVVDCGCGLNATVVSRQVLELPFRRLVSIDGFAPVVELARQRLSRARLRDLLCLNIESLPAHFHYQKSFDVALCLDVLEHVRKPDALELLAHLERIIRQRIVIWLPLGEMRVDTDPHRRGNDLERHRSFWQASDLSERGYGVQILPRFHNARYDALWAVKNLG